MVICSPTCDGAPSALGGIGRRIARHDGVDLIARLTQAVAWPSVGERGRQHVHRAAPAGGEPGTEQAPAAAEVDRRARLDVDGGGVEP